MGPSVEGRGDVGGGLTERDAEIFGEAFSEEVLRSAEVEASPDEAGGTIQDEEAGKVRTGDYQAGFAASCGAWVYRKVPS